MPDQTTNQAEQMAQTGDPDQKVKTPTSDPIVTLICARPGEVAPRAVALSTMPLPSLAADTEVRDWVDSHRSGPLYVMPGSQTSTAGAATLVVPVTEQEYQEIVTAAGFGPVESAGWSDG
jgi:hypothetical protein